MPGRGRANSLGSDKARQEEEHPPWGRTAGVSQGKEKKIKVEKKVKPPNIRAGKRVPNASHFSLRCSK
jgi:hypothetical protein